MAILFRFTGKFPVFLFHRTRGLPPYPPLLSFLSPSLWSPSLVPPFCSLFIVNIFKHTPIGVNFIIKLPCPYHPELIITILFRSLHDVQVTDLMISKIVSSANNVGVLLHLTGSGAAFSIIKMEYFYTRHMCIFNQRG